VAQKYHMMAALLNMGVEKNDVPFSATTTPMYTNPGSYVLVFAFAAFFSNYRSSKSHHRPNVGQNLQIFTPQNEGDTDVAPV